MNRTINCTLSTFLVLTLWLSFCSIGDVSAHQIIPTKTSPAEGEILATSPTEVRLTFSEEISEDGSTVQVFDDQYRQVDQGNGGVDLYDLEHNMLVTSLSNLPQGIYLVKWEVTLLDNDVSTGQYYFGIGNVVLPTSTVPVPTPVAAARTNPRGMLWTVVGAVSLLVFVLVVYFIRNKRS